MINISKEIESTLTKYSEECRTEMQKGLNEVAKKTAENLKEVSPKRTGAYADSWKSKKTKNGYVVYNEDHYRLTHLLEYGYTARNGRRVAAKPHIKNIEQEAVRNAIRKVAEIIDKN